VKSLRVALEGNILDLGTGTGYFLSKLNFTHRFGIDNYVYKSSYNNFKFIQADINQLPLKEKSIDLLLLIDVLEHMQDDKRIVKDCLRVLKTNGKLLIFVPALQILWSDLDRIGMHFRRYNAGKFKKLLTEIDIPHRIIKSSYVNFFLFPLIFLIRSTQAVLKKFRKNMLTHDLEQPNKFINNALRLIFSSERFFLRVLNFPIGVSYVCIIERI
jgi:SAM-dependent methyltransferase